MPDRQPVNRLGNAFASSRWMQALPIRFTSLLPCISSPRNSTHVRRPIHILHKPAGNAFSLPVVSNTLRDEIVSRNRPRETELLDRRPPSRGVPADEPPRGRVTTYIPGWTRAMSRSPSLVHGQQPFASSRIRIRRVESAEVRGATTDGGRRGTAEDSLRGTAAPRPEPEGCAFRLAVLAYQRLPRSPRSPPRPPPPPWPPRPPPPPPWPPRPPPYPPRPPPPPPPRSAWGRASFTTRFRPPKF